jgi:hypothetical protein
MRATIVYGTLMCGYSSWNKCRKGERAEQQTLVFKFDFIKIIMIIHSDESAGGTRHAATRSA